tara:strand:- start:525 stop:899 length:375 start_codon:yes stop_codon:yes gene_type:complete
MIKLKDILSEKIKPKQKITKKEWSKIKKFNKHIGQDGTHYVTQLDKRLGTILVPVIVEEKLTEGKDYEVTITDTRKDKKIQGGKFTLKDDAKLYIKDMVKKHKLKRQKGFWGNPKTGVELTTNF